MYKKFLIGDIFVLRIVFKIKKIIRIKNKSIYSFVFCLVIFDRYIWLFIRIVLGIFLIFVIVVILFCVVILGLNFVLIR